MAGIEFEWDSRALTVFRGAAVDQALARAMRLAGNQAFKLLREGTMSRILAKKALPRRVIEDDQRVSKPKTRTELKDFAWELFIEGKPVPISRFPYLDTRRTSRRGVAVRFGDGGTQRLARAFEATMSSGHVGIFRRERKTSLPIAEMFTSRLPANLGGEVMTTLADPTFRKLESAFKRGLDRELDKLKRKGGA